MVKRARPWENTAPEDNSLLQLPIELLTLLATKLEPHDLLTYRVLAKRLLQIANREFVVRDDSISTHQKTNLLAHIKTAPSSSKTSFSKSALYTLSQAEVDYKKRFKTLIWLSRDNLQLSDIEIACLVKQYRNIWPHFIKIADTDLMKLIVNSVSLNQKKQMIALFSEPVHNIHREMLQYIIAGLHQQDQLAVLTELEQQLINALAPKQMPIVDNDSSYRPDNVAAIISRFMHYGDRGCYDHAAIAIGVVSDRLSQDDIAAILKWCKTINNNYQGRLHCMRSLERRLPAYSNDNLIRYADVFSVSDLAYDNELSSLSRSQVAYLLQVHEDPANASNSHLNRRIFCFALSRAREADLDCFDLICERYIQQLFACSKHSGDPSLMQVMEVIAKRVQNNTLIEKYLLKHAALLKDQYSSYHISGLLENIALLKDKYTPQLIDLFIDALTNIKYDPNETIIYFPLRNIFPGIMAKGSSSQHERLIKPNELKTERSKTDLKVSLLEIIAYQPPHTQEQANWFYDLFMMQFKITQTYEGEYYIAHLNDYLKLFIQISSFITPQQLQQGIEHILVIAQELANKIEPLYRQFSPFAKIYDLAMIATLAPGFSKTQITQLYEWILQDLIALQQTDTGEYYSFCPEGRLVSTMTALAPYFDAAQLEALLTQLGQCYSFQKDKDLHNFDEEVLFGLATFIIHSPKLSQHKNLLTVFGLQENPAMQIYERLSKQLSATAALSNVTPSRFFPQATNNNNYHADPCEPKDRMVLGP